MQKEFKLNLTTGYNSICWFIKNILGRKMRFVVYSS